MCIRNGKTMETPNFILYNLPKWAHLCETNEITLVGYDSMRDTLKKFGKVKVLEIKNGTVKAHFFDKRCAKYAHNLINRKMIGDNIVRTQYVF